MDSWSIDQSIYYIMEIPSLDYYLPAWQNNFKVGDTLTFKCPGDLAFTSNWFSDPVIEMRCLPDGTFTTPSSWPACSDGKSSTS